MYTLMITLASLPEPTTARLEPDNVHSLALLTHEQRNLTKWRSETNSQHVDDMSQMTFLLCKKYEQKTAADSTTHSQAHNMSV